MHLHQKTSGKRTGNEAREVWQAGGPSWQILEFRVTSGGLAGPTKVAPEVAQVAREVAQVSPEVAQVAEVAEFGQRDVEEAS